MSDHVPAQTPNAAPNSAMPVFAPPLPTSGLAVASLVVSIVAWFTLPFIGAFIALVLGYSARQQTRAVPPTASGDGMATAGIVLSWVHLALFGCLCLAVLALLAVGVLVPILGTINHSQP